MHFRQEHTRLMLAWVQVVLFGASLVGCGPGGGGMVDADAGMVDADTDSEALPPDIDWLEAGVPPIAAPSLTPCPEGWRDVGGGAEGDPATCEPYPEGGAAECADGWAHFMGEPGCTPVGAPCPLGDFPEDLPSDSAVLYVLAGAGAGGDGSEAAPLASIGEAMGLASPGTVVALGKGTYDEAVYLAAGVTLWGACARETRLTATSVSLALRGVVQVFAAGTELRNVRIGPAEIPGLTVVGPRAEVTVLGVLIEGTRSVGLSIAGGGSLRGDSLCVSDTRSGSAGRDGYGIDASGESSVTLTRVLLSHNRTIGAFVAHLGTSVTLTDLVVRDTQGRELDGQLGRGLNVQSGATADLTRVLLSRNRSIGVFAANAGTSVTLTDLVVRDTQGRESDGQRGRGLNVEDGAAADVARGVFERNREAGVFASGVGTSVTLVDLVVRDTQSQESDGEAGRGLAVQLGATVDVTRAILERNRDVGLFVRDTPTSVTLADLVVRDTRGRERDGRGGRGLSMQTGATVDVTRALFARNLEIGVLALGEGTVARLSDLAIEEVGEQSCAATTCPERSFGVGLTSVFLASLAATRFAVTDSALCGVFLAENGELDLSVGQVSGSPVGVCLQVESYAVTRLTEGVRYVGNGINLDATNLPLPELSEAIGPSP